MAYIDRPNCRQVFEDAIMLQLRTSRRTTNYNRSKAYSGTSFEATLQNAEEGVKEAFEVLTIDLGSLV